MSDNNRPTVICLCGSTQFKKEYEQVAREETLKGRIVLTLAVFSKADGENLDNEQLTLLHHLHRHKIKMSDEILVINKDGHIGNATKNHIEYAANLGKRIEYMEPIAE